MIRKISEKTRKEICEKVALEISNYITSRISLKHLYVFDIHVDLREESEIYILEVFAYLDVNPFAGVDPQKLLDEAIEHGFNFAKKELEKYGIKEIKLERL